MKGKLVGGHCRGGGVTAEIAPKSKISNSQIAPPLEKFTITLQCENFPGAIYTPSKPELGQLPICKPLITRPIENHQSIKGRHTLRHNKAPPPGNIAKPLEKKCVAHNHT